MVGRATVAGGMGNEPLFGLGERGGLSPLSEAEHTAHTHTAAK